MKAKTVLSLFFRLKREIRVATTSIRAAMLPSPIIPTIREEPTLRSSVQTSDHSIT